MYERNQYPPLVCHLYWPIYSNVCGWCLSMTRTNIVDSNILKELTLQIPVLNMYDCALNRLEFGKRFFEIDIVLI